MFQVVLDILLRKRWQDMRIYLANIHILLGLIVASKTYLVTIRSVQGNDVLKVFGDSIGSTNNPEDLLTTFRVVTKIKSSGKNSTNKVSISPEGNSNLYMLYEKSRGLVLKKKKTYWEYKSAGDNGYVLKMGDKCLTWQSNNDFNMLKCSKGDKRQAFLFEEQESPDDSTTSEDEHPADKARIEETVVKAEVPDNKVVGRRHNESAQSSSESDSDSSASVESATRPIFINLNLKGATLAPPVPNAEARANPSPPVSTTTVYKPISKPPAPKIEKHPIKLPSKVAIKKKRTTIFHNESSSSEDIDDAPKPRTILSDILSDSRDWENEYDKGIGSNSLYPELDKLFGQLHHYDTKHPDIYSSPKKPETEKPTHFTKPFPVKQTYVYQDYNPADPAIPYQANPDTVRSC